MLLGGQCGFGADQSAVDAVSSPSVGFVRDRLNNVCVVFVDFFRNVLLTLSVVKFKCPQASSSGSSVDFVLECGQLCWLVVIRQGRSICTMVWGGPFSGADSVRSRSLTGPQIYLGLAAVLEVSSGCQCGVRLQSRTDGGLFGLARLHAEILCSDFFLFFV